MTGEIKLTPKPNQQPDSHWTTMHIRLSEGMKVKSVASRASATCASKAKVLASGEMIRLEVAVTE